MKTMRSKKTATLIALFLVLTMVASFALPIANAHTPAWTVPTWAYISVSPSPIGAGQSVWVVFWIDKIPNTGGGIGGDRWRNLKIEITKPDDSKETLGPFTSDPVGGGFTTYTPTQVGTYTFVFTFPGQVLSLYNPQTGIPDLATNVWVNDTFQPSSAQTTLIVQQEPIAKISDYPLPSEYWTRPIEGQNTAWTRIASNWLGGEPSVHYNVQPNGIAPESPHIMWTKPLEDGGIAGGTYPGESYYFGDSYEIRFNNPMIIHGRLYYDLPLGSAKTGGGYICVNLYTGETIWRQNWTSALPAFGQLFDYESMNQHGILPNGILWRVVSTNWSAYDSLTGSWLYNLTNVPSGTNLYGPQGEIVRYVLNYPGRWLALWNNTQDNVGLHLSLGTGTNAYQWRPVGKTVDMSKAYSWNVTIPTLPNVGGNPTIQRVISDDLLFGSFGSAPGVDAVNSGFTLFALSLKPTSRGSLLWIKDFPAPTGNLTRYLGPVDEQNRVFTFLDMQTMQWSGYSLNDGSRLWGPVGDPKDFQYYSSRGGGGSQMQSIAYGKLYIAGFGGLVCCYDTKTGNLLWTYGNGGPGNNTSSGLENTWGNYPTFIGMIADGKIYTFTQEHSVNTPIYKDALIRCLNATTGEEIWTLPGFASSTSFYSRIGPIADGYLSYYNGYDGQVYTIGKGPSATTVAASPEISVHGNSVLIKGTVIDKSAGTKQTQQAGKFPNGVPAMADESMSQWMQYVYMQKPMPTNAKGVEVSLDTLDPNGNFVHIGTATSDASGLFSYMFTPEVPGKYTIIATFAGTKSYWPSYSETAIGVQEAPPATAAPEYPQPIDNTWTIVGFGIAIMILVAVFGVLLLSKR